MTVPAGTFQTYTMIGMYEDLTDVITNIAPVDTWFTTNSGNVTVTARYHEWQTDTLANAAQNAQIEGDDATATSVTPTVRTGNYTQILRKVFQIADTADVVDKAGRDTEVGYQTTKNLTELARDVEFALVVNSAAASGASGTARVSNGLMGWIVTNTSSATATGLDITEALFNDNLQLIWAAGGKPKNVLVGAYNKRKISAFTTNTKNTEASEKTLTSAVDIYESDFGTLALRLHFQLHTSSPGTIIILGDMNLWKKGWLRKIKTEKLARTGSSTKIMIEGEMTLESRQEKGSGRILQTKSS